MTKNKKVYFFKLIAVLSFFFFRKKKIKKRNHGKSIEKFNIDVQKVVGQTSDDIIKGILEPGNLNDDLFEKSFLFIAGKSLESLNQSQIYEILYEKAKVINITNVKKTLPKYHITLNINEIENKVNQLNLNSPEYFAFIIDYHNVMTEQLNLQKNTLLIPEELSKVQKFVNCLTADKNIKPSVAESLIKSNIISYEQLDKACKDKSILQVKNIGPVTAKNLKKHLFKLEIIALVAQQDIKNLDITFEKANFDKMNFVYSSNYGVLSKNVFSQESSETAKRTEVETKIFSNEAAKKAEENANREKIVANMTKKIFSNVINKAISEKTPGYDYL